jgi:ribosomal-protein-alanine N-acetyltransferase
MSDFLQWAHLRETSRNYLTPWEPIWPSDDLTRAGFRRRLRRYAEDAAADRSYGHMTAALRVLLPVLFGELNLHRVEAACIPTNAPSIRVLEKCGFTREGLARRYLCINGVWQDHLLFGLLHEDFRG